MNFVCYTNIILLTVIGKGDPVEIKQLRKIRCVKKKWQRKKKIQWPMQYAYASHKKKTRMLDLVHVRSTKSLRV